MIARLMIYALLIFTASIMGGLLPLFAQRYVSDDQLFKKFLSLGAGILLGMALLHMLPEASRHLPDSYSLWFLLGFVVLLVLERFIMVHTCEEGSCDYHTIGIAAFAGLTVHGVIEGLALGASIAVTSLAPLVLIAILSHKIPSSLSLSSILTLAKTLSRKQIVAFIVGVSFSVPLGMFVAFFLFEHQLGNISAILIAISAGTFLYIATCNLLPASIKKIHNG